MSSLKGWLWVLLGLASPPMALATGISALLDTGGRDWVPRDSEIVIRLSEPPDPGAGGFAVVVGTSDLTDLFRFDGEALTYRPELQPLPAGETEIVVYRVPQGEPWSEIGRFPLRVLRKGGFEQVELRPRIDIESIARLDDGPDETGEETGFEDATAQLGLQGTFARGGWKVDASMNVVGVTDRQKALRFSQDGPEAQKIDLSQYSVDVSRGRGRFSLGHLSYGRGRNLIESFNSRGLSLEVPLGSWGQAGLGVLNGSSIVGWDNFLGIDDRRHQLVAGHLAVEVVPDQPGRLHLLVSALDGSVLPLAGFNQGVVNDSEESRGWALEVASAAFSNRLRFSGGYTESRFDNPSDPLLDPGFDLVPVETETRGARFSDLAFDLFQNRGRKHPTTLTLAWRHREVEPQFRSVGAFAQADRRENTGELMLASGPISFQLSVSGSRDNLDDVASILTTRTRGSSAAFLIPFG
ncbi:MAG: hypothetical protein KDD47_26045, partial [Acidobacteria bacterium]|nr:hypothetical protein [Acidobacteriota bacterium]